MPYNDNPGLPQPTSGPAGFGPPSNLDHGYDFIFNHDKPHRSPLTMPLPGPNSWIGRSAMVAGGLVVLIILYAVLSSLLSSPSNVPALLSVAEDQTELIHITSSTSNIQNVATYNQNFAATAQLSLTSAVAQLTKYLASNGHSPSQSQLNYKVSASVDQKLTNAQSNGNYDQTFQAVASSWLNRYLSDLNLAYKQTSGSKGRALLIGDYRQANLLLTELNSPYSNG